MTVYVSTLCLPYLNYRRRLDVYNRLGLTHIELGVCLDSSINSYNLINQYACNYIVHHLFPPPKREFILNLASPNTDLRKLSIAQICNSIDFCSQFGISLFTFHSGFRVDPDKKFRFRVNGIPPYKQSMDFFRKSLCIVLNHAVKKNVRIAIENNVVCSKHLLDDFSNFLLMSELSEFEILFAEFKSPYFGLLLDLGHLKVSSHTLHFDPNEFIASLENVVFAIHVHENNSKDDQHLVFDEQDWVYDILTRFFKHRDIPIVIEAKCSNEADLLDCYRLLSLNNRGDDNYRQ